MSTVIQEPTIAAICSRCGVYEGHLATCPTKLDTRNKRIAYVAHRWNTQYSYRDEYLAMGFTDEEIAEGNKLGRAREDEWQGNRVAHGNPCYGSWPDNVAQPVRDRIKAMATLQCCDLFEKTGLWHLETCGNYDEAAVRDRTI